MADIRPAEPAVSEAAVLTKAALRAAERLAVNNRTLAAIVGVSEPSVSRMKKGDYALAPGQKAFELGVLFVRLYRSLDAIVSGDDEVARRWLRNPNVAPGKVPIDMIQTVAGLTDVIRYLDARRALV